MMRSRVLGIAGDIEPELVHEFDVLCPQPGSVGTQSEFADAAIRQVNLDGQSRLRFGQPFPGGAGQLSLLVGSEFV